MKQEFDYMQQWGFEVKFEDVQKELDKGMPLYLTLNTLAVAKLTKLTIADNESEPLYEVVTTVPNIAKSGIEELKFLYKKLLGQNEFEEFLKTYYQED